MLDLMLSTSSCSREHHNKSEIKRFSWELDHHSKTKSSSSSLDFIVFHRGVELGRVLGILKQISEGEEEEEMKIFFSRSLTLVSFVQRSSGCCFFLIMLLRAKHFGCRRLAFSIVIRGWNSLISPLLSLSRAMKPAFVRFQLFFFISFAALALQCENWIMMKMRNHIVIECVRCSSSPNTAYSELEGHLWSRQLLQQMLESDNLLLLQRACVRKRRIGNIFFSFYLHCLTKSKRAEEMKMKVFHGNFFALFFCCYFFSETSFGCFSIIPQSQHWNVVITNDENNTKS